MSGFTVHLKYTTIPLPRQRGFLIMDYDMSQGANKEDLSSISRVRGLLYGVFVSEIVTADGKCLEEFVTARTSSREHASKYKFLKEAPT